MNEITRIHLGRQPFMISVEAHHTLKSYLAEIQKQVADKDVVDEVELRMAELLGERGIVGEKVILAADIAFMKQQLGNPADFSDEGDAPAPQATEAEIAKRLFRDTDGAYLAGVAAGLASYFGLDVVLVRIVFVLLTLFGGGFGILLYIVLWLVVPPAVTSSEKLQMRGKPVTVDALKEAVSKADLPGATKRAKGTLLPVIDGIFKVLLKIVGLGFIVSGLAVISGIVIVKIYMMLHHGQLFEENFFPVGTREQWLMNLGMVLGTIAAVFSILAGMAVFRRSWPIRGWATAVLAGVFLAIATGAAALSADVGPQVQARYQTSMHTTGVQNVQPFNKVTTSGGIDVEYTSSPNYSVSLHYYGHPDLSKIKISTSDKTLHVDSTAFDDSRHCAMLCIFPHYNIVVQVAAPNVQSFDSPSGTEFFYPAPQTPAPALR